MPVVGRGGRRRHPRGGGSGRGRGSAGQRRPSPRQAHRAEAAALHEAAPGRPGPTAPEGRSATIGRTYTAPDGTEYRPSMWLTVTLDSYGPVRPDGSPVDPTTYDYRRAAWDAITFPRLLDRFWQNLRRCVGWNVQYAGCVEPQRRLAPHAHFAIRGTIPRAVLRQVVAATYHQVWWPKAEELSCRPVWDADAETWCDSATGNPLIDWDTAVDAIDDEPAHVTRFGAQVRAEGVNANDRDVDRTIGYITKYITKSAADCHTVTTDRQRDHLERFWRELLVTPCSERCANWLLYGIQPKNAHARLRPGNCKGRVHQRSTLGIGGRRIPVSRDWSGKTLADHRYDARAWVQALLGVSDGDTAADPESLAPVAWELARPNDPDLPPMRHRLLRALAQRIQWRNALNAARDRAAQYDSTTVLSATGDDGGGIAARVNGHRHSHPSGCRRRRWRCCSGSASRR
ncbi:replication initiator [Dactylosporangium sp. CA-052675]|uniref:replication initiator n=1 Tax=Dactylosporangium sp. CA-052675 TaxID=3239927 RepID=UPI003D925A30